MGNHLSHHKTEYRIFYIQFWFPNQERIHQNKLYFPFWAFTKKFSWMASLYNAQRVCVWLAVFNRLLHSRRFWQVSTWRFHCFKSSLMASNQHFFWQPRLQFPSTSKSKICLVYISPRFTCPNQRSMLHFNTESRLFSFNRLGREFVLTHCSFAIFSHLLNLWYAIII